MLWSMLAHSKNIGVTLEVWPPQVARPELPNGTALSQRTAQGAGEPSPDIHDATAPAPAAISSPDAPLRGSVYEIPAA